MSRATTVTIDCNAIRSNFRLAQQSAGQSKAMAVVKANAYGHGLKEVVDALHEAPAFAVAIIDEAIALRELTTKPILILEGISRPDELALTKSLQLIPAIHNQHQLSLIAENPDHVPPSVWVVMDTGMARLGFRMNEVERAIDSLRDNKLITELVIYSHMANASSPDMESNEVQLNAVLMMKQRYPDIEFSLANSAALLSSNKYHMDWNRVGIMLYGGSPFDDINHPLTQQLKPAMSLNAEVIAIRDLDIGESAGYGSTWTAQRPSKIATIAVGYADGYPRHAPSGTPVYLRGKRVPLAGRVSMDMIMVDITDHPIIDVGDQAELFGANISINEIAEAAGTISYHLMTSISPRVRREYC